MSEILLTLVSGDHSYEISCSHSPNDGGVVTFRLTGGESLPFAVRGPVAQYAMTLFGLQGLTVSSYDFGPDPL
jgi:hypothetical protein